MQVDRASRVSACIRDIPDFPIPGVLFKDITPVLQDPDAFRDAIDLVAELFAPDSFDVIVGLESRGFVFGAPVAYKLGRGFVPVRKLGKLPAPKLTVAYELEYGSHTLEMHTDGILPGQRALIVDDLLATGGTCGAAVNLVERLGGIVTGGAFLVELGFLHGREKLAGVEVRSVVRY
jgi:adenine phosphoribosyltransferase